MVVLNPKVTVSQMAKVLLIKNNRALISLCQGTTGFYLVDLNTMTLKTFYKPSPFFSYTGAFANAISVKDSIFYYEAGFGFGVYDIKSSGTIANMDSLNLSNYVSDLDIFSVGGHAFLACGLYLVGMTAFFNIDVPHNPTTESFYFNSKFIGAGVQPYIAVADSILLIACKPGLKTAVMSYYEKPTGTTVTGLRAFTDRGHSIRKSVTYGRSYRFTGSVYDIRGRLQKAAFSSQAVIIVR